MVLARSCWPGVLAPRLASTRAGFSYAAARATKVAVVGVSAVAADAAAAQLALWGYQATVQAGWKPPLSVRAVYYHAGARRAALALAGDLRLVSAAVMEAPAAPAAVTLGLPD